MNITTVTATYAEAANFFDRYEAAHVAPSPQGQHLMDATVQVFQSRLPAPLHPLAKQLISTMLDDDRLTQALGLSRSTWASRTALKSGLAIRNAVHRRRPLRRQPHFTPGSAGSSTLSESATAKWPIPQVAGTWTPTTAPSSNAPIARWKRAPAPNKRPSFRTDQENSMASCRDAASHP
ncbi:hypothetical protein ABIB27_000771 [Arthrobacter sp. UYEF21]